jgi:hypothetical protein
MLYRLYRHIDFYIMFSIAYTVHIFMLPLKPRPLDAQRGQRENDDRVSAGVSNTVFLRDSEDNMISTLYSSTRNENYNIL